MEETQNQQKALLTPDLETRVSALALAGVPLLAATPVLFNIWTKSRSEGVAAKTIISVLVLLFAFGIASVPSFLFVNGLTRLASDLAQRRTRHIGPIMLMTGTAIGSVIGATIGLPFYAQSRALVVILIFGLYGTFAGFTSSAVLFGLLRHRINAITAMNNGPGPTHKIG